MTFLPRVLLLAAAAYGAAVIAGSFVLSAAAPKMLRSRRSSTDWLMLRSAPALFAAAVFMLATAALVLYEPREGDERIGVLVIAVAAIGAASLAGAAVSLTRRFLETTRAARLWLQSAEPLTVAGITAPAYAVNAAFPIVAVIGLLKPRLVVARSVLDACSKDELRIVAAHEQRHIDRRDNLRRFLLAALPDLCRWPLRTDAIVVRAWHDAAEEEADTEAAASGPEAAVDLASALVKVARLAATARADAMLPTSALYRGGDINRRVQRLLDPGITRQPSARTRAPRVVIAGLLIALALLRPIHLLVEAVVAYLP